MSKETEPGKTKNVDETEIVNTLKLPERWRCPHCGRGNTIGPIEQDIFTEHFKVISECRYCGYLHIFTLKLTEDFKKGVVNMVKGEISYGS